MTREQVAQLKVGSKIKDCLGDIKVVVSIRDNIMYELKWVQPDNSLSKGSEFQVPSHFKYDELVSL